MWNAFDQCCPEDGETFDNAVPNHLECPSSLRVDFDEQLTVLAIECRELIFRRNMSELIQIKKFIESQRSQFILRPNYTLKGQIYQGVIMNTIDKKSILQKLEQRLSALQHMIDKDITGNTDSALAAWRETKWIKEAIERGEFDIAVW